MVSPLSAERGQPAGSYQVSQLIAVCVQQRREHCRRSGREHRRANRGRQHQSIVSPVATSATVCKSQMTA
jgi:hypothetical protein